LNETKSYRKNSATQNSGSAMFFCYANMFMFGRDEPLVEHKVLTVQEHLCSTPCLVWFVLLGFLCSIFSTIVRLVLSFDHCIDCLSSKYASDYHFGNFKLFLSLYFISWRIRCGSFWNIIEISIVCYTSCVTYLV
jgi:hypothetical protein